VSLVRSPNPVTRKNAHPLKQSPTNTDIAAVVQKIWRPHTQLARGHGRKTEEQEKTRMSFAQPRPEKELAYAQARDEAKTRPCHEIQRAHGSPKARPRLHPQIWHYFWHGNLPGCTVAPKKIETFFEDFTISKMEVEFWNNTRSFGCENT
jgi:hypothetical protein